MKNTSKLGKSRRGRLTALSNQSRVTLLRVAFSRDVLGNGQRNVLLCEKAVASFYGGLDAQNLNQALLRARPVV